MNVVLKLILFAGGPGSGKTSVIRRLAERLREDGYSVYIIRDWAREIIRREKKKGSDGILPWTNRLEFERLVLKHYIREYEKIFNENPSLFDMILEDGGGFATKAYCNVDGIPTPNEYEVLLRYIDRVDLVFLMDLPRRYHKDSERWEDYDYAIKIHFEIMNLHKQLFHNKIVLVKYMEKLDDKVNYVYSVLMKKLF